MVCKFFVHVCQILVMGQSMYCSLTLYHTISTFNDLGKEVFWKHSGKPAFSLLFLQCFLAFFPRHIPNFKCSFFLSSANAFSLDQSRNLYFGKELKLYHKIPRFNNFDKEGFFFVIIVGKGNNSVFLHVSNCQVVCIRLSVYRSFNPLPDDKF